jgi:hypothetical protein
MNDNNHTDSMTVAMAMAMAMAIAMAMMSWYLSIELNCCYLFFVPSPSHLFF